MNSIDADMATIWQFPLRTVWKWRGLLSPTKLGLAFIDNGLSRDSNYKVRMFSTCCCWRFIEAMAESFVKQSFLSKTAFKSFYLVCSSNRACKLERILSFSFKENGVTIKSTMNQFKCKEISFSNVIWLKILFPLELIFDSCNNIMMKNIRNMSVESV